MCFMLFMVKETLIYSSRLSGPCGVHMQGAGRSRRLVAFASTATPQMGAAGPALRGTARVPVSALRLFDVFSIRLQSRALIPERGLCLRRDE